MVVTHELKIVGELNNPAYRPKSIACEDRVKKSPAQFKTSYS